MVIAYAKGAKMSEEVSETGNKLLKAVHGNLNVPGLVSEVNSQVLGPALKKIVEDTSNPFDDVLFNAVYPLLTKTLNEEVQKLWDGIMPAPVVKSGELL